MLGRRPARAQDSGVWSGERLVGARWSTCRALNTPSPPPYPQVCVHCGATTTCFWRRAEKGDGYVCNACGGCLPLAARLLGAAPAARFELSHTCSKHQAAVPGASRWR